MGQGRPSATLVIRQGPQAGMSFPLVGNQMTIGREEGLEISLQDPEASRRHARISWQAGQYIIEDLGSTNGTFVNGIQITTPQILSPGDSVGVGQTALVFQVAGAAMGAPQYQSPPAQHPAAAPVNMPAAPAESGNNQMLQYALYGCGCLLLLLICALIVVAVWAIFNQDVIDGLLSAQLTLWQLPPG
ncbi:MAG: FHA domain-containing protein [Chloroflexi bacterium]|nr:MAG: FHA domain-containing protein [Chloroflexota bacterium]